MQVLKYYREGVVVGYEKGYAQSAHHRHHHSHRYLSG
jgi:hypothetical protein